MAKRAKQSKSCTDGATDNTTTGSTQQVLGAEACACWGLTLHVEDKGGDQTALKQHKQIAHNEPCMRNPQRAALPQARAAKLGVGKGLIKGCDRVRVDIDHCTCQQVYVSRWM